MCGIIGAINMDKELGPVNEEVVDIYQDQKDRGTEGFGAVIIKKDRTIEVKRATTEAKLIVDLSMQDNLSEMVFMHHRNPTATKNKLKQTHPIITDNGSLKYKYLTIHNGVIRNDKELQKEHQDKLGFNYTTLTKEESYGYEKTTVEEKFNDSECIAIEVARLIEGQTKGLKVEGSVAFITLQIDKKTNKVKQVYFGRNHSNPLNLAASRKKMRLSSEGAGDPIKAEMLYHFGLKDFKIKKQKLLFLKQEKEKEEKEETKTIGTQSRIPTYKQSPNIDTTEEEYENSKIMPGDIDVFRENMIEEIGAILNEVAEDFETYEKLLTIDIPITLRKIAEALYQAKTSAEETYIELETNAYQGVGEDYEYDPELDFDYPGQRICGGRKI